jgi:hypothetical protein
MLTNPIDINSMLEKTILPMGHYHKLKCPDITLTDYNLMPSLADGLNGMARFTETIYPSARRPSQ